MSSIALKASQAVEIAKDQLLALFKDEQLQNVGLEEVEPAAAAGWKITFGFSRPWNNPKSPTMAAIHSPQRSYKVVSVSISGEVLSIKNRD